MCSDLIFEYDKKKLRRLIRLNVPKQFAVVCVARNMVDCGVDAYQLPVVPRACRSPRVRIYI